MSRQEHSILSPRQEEAAAVIRESLNRISDTVPGPEERGSTIWIDSAEGEQTFLGFDGVSSPKDARDAMKRELEAAVQALQSADPEPV